MKKEKSIKKFLCAFVILLVVLMSIAPINSILNLGIKVSANGPPSEHVVFATGQCGENVFWSYNKTTCELIISGTGDMFNYDWESPFTNSDIKSIVIEDGVTSIGDYAFNYCMHLTSISLTDGIKSIGDSAFSSCSALASFTIPKSVETIGWCAFNNCYSLENIIIPDSVINIDYLAFARCFSLNSIFVDKNNTSYYSDSFGVLFDKNDKKLIQYPIGNERASYSIPNNVDVVGQYAFSGCENLKSIIIGNDVTTIGGFAFEYCRGLTEVSFGSNVEMIGEEAFLFCEAIKNITIPVGVTNIGNGAFQCCTLLENVTIGSDTAYIGDSAFEGCSSLENIVVDENNEYYSSDSSGVLFNKDKTELILYPTGNTQVSYEIPNSVKELTIGAFCNVASLENLRVGSGAMNIESNNFYGCTSLKSIAIDENNEYYSSDSSGVLFNKDKTELILYPAGNTRELYTIPDGVIKIDRGAFLHCISLESVIIPNGVMTIEMDSFCGCTSLKNISIPDSVTDIGDMAFENCTSLENVTIGRGAVSIYCGTFTSCKSIKSIIVDENNEYYSSDSSGVLFNKDKTELILYPTGNTQVSYEIPNGVKNIGDTAFYNCVSLKNVTIPDSVISIGCAAFSNCTSLESVTIGNGVMIIDSGAFNECISLNDITIGNWVKSIGSNAFYKTAYYSNIDNWKEGVLYIGKYLISADALITSCDIKNGTQCIADAAFDDCTSLKSVKMPNSVINIGDFSFGNCVSLESITIPNSVTKIGDSTFANCESLESIVIPGSITDIGWGAFLHCTTLESITISDSVTSIGEYAFFKCSSLLNVYYAGSEGDWNDVIIGDNNELLKNATINYNSSVVSNIVKDPTTGVKLTYTSDNFTDTFDLTVSVDIVNANIIFSDYKKFKAYNITLEADGKNIQPKDNVIVKLPLPTDYNKNNTVVYYVNESGEKTLIKSEIKGGYIVFETDHFSEYVIVDLSSKKVEHTHEYTTSQINPTCTQSGSITYFCACGDTYTDTIPATGHIDTNSDSYCDSCGLDLNPQAHCSCNCHKSGIVHFFFVIINFFQKLFGNNKVCACGAIH